MARKSFVFMVVGTVIFFLCSISSADVPHMINYQGKLTPSGGGCLNDTVQMTFSIYLDTLGSPAQWTETQAQVVVKDGIFNVLLGSVNSIPASVFDGNIKYLGVKVESDPEMRPLKPMVSVPYAYRAGTADGDGGSHWSVADSVLYTNNYWGVARGSAGNVLYGNNAHTMVNLGVASTTGTSGQNYEYCTVGGGESNTASRELATVGGGSGNTASNYAATVGGGANNIASDENATVGGGSANTASGNGATVGGGGADTASGENATVGGGNSNTASGGGATVGGGLDNIASGTIATVTGGGSNTASNYAATVGGGGSNTASGENATVGGGTNDTASGNYATIGGGYDNTASGSISTIGGGNTNTANFDYATVGGGVLNSAGGYSATVGGGYQNEADHSYATVGGGRSNNATGNTATVAGGYNNVANFEYTTVGGGNVNSAGNNYATVGGGYDNKASGYASIIGGGYQNSNAGDWSAIPGGYADTLTSQADYSMAFGRCVYVSSSNYVVFFDSTSIGHLQLNRDHRDAAPTGYPIRVGTSVTNGNAAFLSGGGVWTDVPPRFKRDNFQKLDGAPVLDKIENMSVTQWKFKGTEERHIGPAAEDFYRAFGCGTGILEDDSTSISPMDLAGVSLVAIQELTRIVKEQQKQIEALKAQLEKLESNR